MDSISRRILYTSTSAANGAPLSGKIINGLRYRRTMSTTNILGAAKTPKAPTKAPQKKPWHTTRKPPISSQTPTHPASRPNPLRYRTIPIIFGSITLFAISGYCSYLYVALTRAPESTAPTSAAKQEDVSKRYNTIASSFDDSVAFTESIMGITSLRKKLMAQAHGDVLEVSIGTGRNLEFYDWDFKGYNGVGKANHKGVIQKGKIRSFTVVDQSAEMLEIAHQKFSTMFPGILGVRWIIGDAAASGVIPGPPKNANERSGSLDGAKYDTIVQTMGLCSVTDPVALLRNLGEWVKEEDGRILLLEHGRGRWEWLNGVLDRFAEGHAREFGCWWNRDLRRVVGESGLEVVKVEQPKWWHGGTTWWIELKKPGAKSRRQTLQEEEKVGEAKKR